MSWFRRRVPVDVLSVQYKSDSGWVIVNSAGDQLHSAYNNGLLSWPTAAEAYTRIQRARSHFELPAYCWKSEKYVVTNGAFWWVTRNLEKAQSGGAWHVAYMTPPDDWVDEVRVPSRDPSPEDAKIASYIYPIW